MNPRALSDWVLKQNLFARIRQQKPVIHCITNYVTAGDVANLLLAAGASPIMADHEQEAEEIASISQAEVLNLGTFRDSAAGAMLKAGLKAASLGHPVVLDPVGIGVSSVRRQMALRILKEVPCTAIRGNASEILTLAALLGADSPCAPAAERGVDTADFPADASAGQPGIRLAVSRLALKTGAIVVMTGPEDLICDGRRCCLVRNGHPMMSRITGSGCMLDGFLAAALCAAEPGSAFAAAAWAVSAMGVCGQAAHEKVRLEGGGTGSFRVALTDAVSLMKDSMVETLGQVEFVNSLDLRLYAVTDRSWTGSVSLYRQVEQALEAGVTLVQLREKGVSQDDFLKEALEIKALTDRYGVPLIINDSVEVALACGAAGVHVGQSDLDAARARQMLGPDRILGVTAKTTEQALRAQAAGADYLGSGAVFGSATKKDAVPMTLDRLKEITAAVSIPVAAIGGIQEDNIGRLQGTGIAGAAVVSGIFSAPDIGQAVRSLRRQADAIVSAGRI